MCERVALWFLCLFLALLSFSWIALLNFDVTIFYFIKFYFVMFCCYLLRGFFFFLFERQNEFGLKLRCGGIRVIK